MQDKDFEKYFISEVSSNERALAMFEKMCSSDATEASKWFVCNWSNCDNFYHIVDDVRDILEGFNFRAEDLVLDKDRWWWNSLPEELLVYRGCEEGRENGLSWTLDKTVAEVFAQGHRARSLAKPQIYEKTIRKSQDVFFATNLREEQEVVC